MATLQNEEILITVPSGRYLGFDVNEVRAPIGTFETIAANSLQTTVVNSTTINATNIVTVNFGATTLTTDNLVPITPGAGVTIDNMNLRVEPHYALARDVAIIGAAAPSDLALLSDGGSLVANIPDGTAAGGDSRGTNCVDLQKIRAASNQVSAGIANTIGGGQSNQINPASSFCTIGGGSNNVVTGSSNCAAVGSSNTVTSSANSVSVGFNNAITASNAVSIGTNSSNTSTNSVLIAPNGGPSSGNDAITLRANRIFRAAFDYNDNGVNGIRYGNTITSINNTWFELISLALPNNSTARLRVSGVCTRNNGDSNDFEVYTRVTKDGAGTLTFFSAGASNTGYAAVWQGAFSGVGGIGGANVRYIAAGTNVSFQVISNTTETVNRINWVGQMEYQYVSRVF